MAIRPRAAKGSRAGRLSLLILLVLLLAATAIACGTTPTTHSTGTTTLTLPPATGPAVPGSITASASGVTGQTGKVLSIGVYDFDWEPGKPEDRIAVINLAIDSDPFSASSVLYAVGADGSPSTEPATLQPGDYSVVFFVVSAGQAPEKFTEVRVTVAGDIQVEAPAWGTW
jgi:hypothetical protein